MRVLLFEPNPELLRKLIAEIRKKRPECDITGCTDDNIIQASDFDPDTYGAIIAEANMSRPNGFYLLEMLEDRESTVPLLLHSFSTTQRVFGIQQSIADLCQEHYPHAEFHVRRIGALGYILRFLDAAPA
jgi:DNA-binding response OmpR family regulator